MKQLRPYLIFSGNCREALTFYKECLDGEITLMQTYDGAPVDFPDDHKQLIFNAEFRADDVCFGASDNMPNDTLAVGRNFALFVEFSEGAEQEKVFAKLADGGNIMMPLADSPGGARFGMLTDKFDIQWMLAAAKE